MKNVAVSGKVELEVLPNPRSCFQRGIPRGIEGTSWLKMMNKTKQRLQSALKKIKRNWIVSSWDSSEYGIFQNKSEQSEHIKLNSRKLKTCLNCVIWPVFIYCLEYFSLAWIFHQVIYIYPFLCHKIFFFLNPFGTLAGWRVVR